MHRWQRRVHAACSPCEREKRKEGITYPRERETKKDRRKIVHLAHSQKPRWRGSAAYESSPEKRQWDKRKDTDQIAGSGLVVEGKEVCRQVGAQGM